jgi:hypothetical protein
MKRITVLSSVMLVCCLSQITAQQKKVSSVALRLGMYESYLFNGKIDLRANGVEL